MDRDAKNDRGKYKAVIRDRGERVSSKKRDKKIFLALIDPLSSV